MDPYPEETEATQATKAMAEIVLSFVPSIGGALQTIFAKTAARKLEERRAFWLNYLASLLQQLQDRVAALEDLPNDPLFMDALVTSVRIADRTSREEKLDLLRNAVVNSVMRGAPDADLQMVFFRWIDEFTVSHLQLLILANSPTDWYKSHDIPMVSDSTTVRQEMVERAMPWFAGKREVIEVVERDLIQANLIHSGILVPFTGDVIYESLTTEVGKRFVAFITKI